MSSSAPEPPPEPTPPPRDPQAIRAALPPPLAAEFDHEWSIVLDRVRESMDLADVHDLLDKWRHTAAAENRDRGSYGRMLSKADRILATGRNPDAVAFEHMQSIIRRRQGR